MGLFSSLARRHSPNFPKPPKTIQSGWSWLVWLCHRPLPVVVASRLSCLESPSSALLVAAVVASCISFSGLYPGSAVVSCDSICRLVCLQSGSLLRLLSPLLGRGVGTSSAQVKSSAALITNFSSIAIWCMTHLRILSSLSMSFASPNSSTSYFYCISSLIRRWFLICCRFAPCGNEHPPWLLG
jgi:hypothetical protein